MSVKKIILIDSKNYLNFYDLAKIIIKNPFILLYINNYKIYYERPNGFTSAELIHLITKQLIQLSLIDEKIISDKFYYENEITWKNYYSEEQILEFRESIDWIEYDDMTHEVKVIYST